jgi:hypothetical protein
MADVDENGSAYRSIEVLSACARKAFHHQTSATLRDVCNDCGSAMNLSDDTQIDREREMNRCALLQAEIFSFDEDAVRTQVSRSAQLPRTTWNSNVDRRACAMTCMKASLHRSTPRLFGLNS